MVNLFNFWKPKVLNLQCSVLISISSNIVTCFKNFTIRKERGDRTSDLLRIYATLFNFMFSEKRHEFQSFTQNIRILGQIAHLSHAHCTDAINTVKTSKNCTIHTMACNHLRQILFIPLIFWRRIIQFICKTAIWKTNLYPVLMKDSIHKYREKQHFTA